MGGMSGGKGGGAPNAPDFARAAEAQAQSGRINQSNPFGSTHWDGNTQTTEFSGGLGQGAQNLMGQIGSQGPLGTGEDARNQAITGAYNQATSRLDPQWSQREESQRSQLANQGLDPGSEAYGNAMGDFSRSRNDAYSSAMNGAIAQGTSAGDSIFRNNLAGQMAPYQQLGSLASLMSGLSGQGRETQYLPAAMSGYNADLQNYGIGQQGKNSMLGGLGGLAGTGLGFAFGGPAGAMLGGGLGSNLGG